MAFVLHRKEENKPQPTLQEKVEELQLQLTQKNREVVELQNSLDMVQIVLDDLIMGGTI